MKITRRDLGVLMIIAGIIIAFLGYKMSFEPTQEEIEKLQSEQASIKNEIDSLQPLVKASDTYKANMKTMNENIEKIMSEFASDIWQEDNIMYVVEMLDKLNVKVPTFSAAAATEISSVEGTGNLAGKKYSFGRATISASYTADSYDDMKEFINFVYSDKDVKRVIDSISMTFSPKDGTISGNASIFQYVMNDSTRTYTKAELPDDDLGIESECIFGETEEAEE
jgi:myosin heavy subunit